MTTDYSIVTVSYGDYILAHKDLPKVIGGSVDEKSTATHSGEESMKIAWRYQNLPKFQVPSVSPCLVFLDSGCGHWDSIVNPRVAVGHLHLNWHIVFSPKHLE